MIRPWGMICIRGCRSEINGFKGWRGDGDAVAGGINDDVDEK